MEKFVNRDDELAEIDKTIEILQNDQYPLKTPIIEFYGVDGIGKTTLLQKIEEKCRDRKVLCERKNIGEITAQYLAESAQKLLSKKMPVVMILDAFDATAGKELGAFELELRNLIFAPGKICIVLASRSIHHFEETPPIRNAYLFEKTPSIARKLKIYPLKPLSREYCFSSLEDVDQGIVPGIRELIYEWTQGYPLAMDIMVEAIQVRHIDPRISQDQKVLVAIITDKIINQNLLASVQSDPPRFAYFQMLLSILSFPRSFNLVIMQDLIENYAAEYALKSSLAYIMLPNEINQVADVISWEIQKSGYCIDTSIRNIFLLKSRIEDPDLYININEHLMKMNRRFAFEVPGSDRIRYLREYLYHFAKSGMTTKNPEALLEELEELVKKDPPDQFLRFYEEFWQDEDLRNALDSDAKKVITFIRTRFIELYKELPEGIERFHYLLSFLSHTLPDAIPGNTFSVLAIENPFLILEPAIRQIMEEEKVAVYAKFYDILSQDQTLKESLGKDFERILLFFADSSLGDREIGSNTDAVNE